ncbi:VirD4-like conjugal transfer protein, CD1115 family [Lactobacillus gasseri]|uniref:VirD4-like conjugal transfer protein, CD1115 family n=1 Tax=Lactobacillus gasseri TaxID=1596 RepID=UPI0011905B9C|nr:type IV secretory system conjugative DNA transfer family protein [Lactobacillus gasseri]TVU92744.1 conjugal transfer protein [Lactobacillus gasseri]TVV16473.1 conjugal transfer protein [Lactobacillus gasseri]
MQNIGFTVNQEEKFSKMPWNEEYSSKSTIFGKRTFLPINYKKALNDNTLVIGSSGTGKTYSFVEPNVLQGNANYIIADAKGSILEDIGSSLLKMGYNIQVLNLVDLAHSMTYNPLANMESALDVRSFADQVLLSTTDGVKIHGTQDPFWNKSAATLLCALIYFVQEFLPKDEQNMSTVTRLYNAVNKPADRIKAVIQNLSGKEYEYMKKTSDLDEEKIIGDYLFDWAREKKPDSLAVKMWDEVVSGKSAEKMWASIVSILGSSLSAYNLSDIDRLLSSNRLKFERLLKPKTALFILYDDADPTKNFISNTLYSQLFRFLYHKAFQFDDKKLPVKIRFYLDDFKNILIPNFDDYLATARSRNISVCMMLQDESQLKAKFGVNTASVIGNCSAYLLTGTTDLSMARIAADRFNQTAQSIRIMDEDHFLLDVGGYLRKTERYEYQDHPNYVNKKFNINKFFKTPDIDPSNWAGLCSILKDLPIVETPVLNLNGELEEMDDSWSDDKWAEEFRERSNRIKEKIRRSQNKNRI